MVWGCFSVAGLGSGTEGTLNASAYQVVGLVGQFHAPSFVEQFGDGWKSMMIKKYLHTTNLTVLCWTGNWNVTFFKKCHLSAL